MDHINWMRQLSCESACKTASFRMSRSIGGQRRKEERGGGEGGKGYIGLNPVNDIVCGQPHCNSLLILEWQGKEGVWGLLGS